MSTSQKQLLNEVKAGHDGPQIPEAKRVYFQERLRNRFFEFLLQKFLEQQKHGLTQAKLARRIGKKPDVISRWLGAPSNLTLDTISDLLLGISAEELEMGAKSFLNRPPANFSHLVEFHDVSARKPAAVEITGGTVKAKLISTEAA